MAANAGRAVQRVVVIHVTVGALPWRHHVHAGQSESSGGVIKPAVGPRDCVVTLLASGRETRMRHWARGMIVVILMAVDACRAGDVVVVIDVAIGALPRWHHVRARQRKSRLGVV